MTALPEVPGIIEAAMTITPVPDGRLSLRVLIGAGTSQPRDYDLIELIISPGHVRHALAGAKIRALTSPESSDELPTFPCHVGLYRNSEG